MKEASDEVRLKYFDSLRGIAATMVFLSHYLVAYGLNDRLAWIYFSPVHVLFDGFVAVSLFFVLSGIVLSLRYLSFDHRFFIVPFLISRTFRILLPFLFALSCYWFLYTFLVDGSQLNPLFSNWMMPFLTGSSSLPDFAVQAIFAQPPSGHVYLMPHAWTLGVELLFSYLLPVFVILALRSRWALIYGVILVGLLNLGVGMTVFGLFFIAGCLVSVNYKAIVSLGTVVPRLWRYFLLVVAMLLLSVRFSVFELFHMPIGPWDSVIWACNGIGALIVVIHVIGSTRMQSCLSVRPLIYLGRVSYSFYLIHFLVIGLLSPVVISLIYRVIPHVAPAVLIGLLPVYGITVGFAQLLHSVVERPSNHLGKLLSKMVTPVHVE